MKNTMLIVLMIVLFGILGFNDTAAQCAMCKGAAEMNLKQGGGDPQGLNNGILYMLATPYLLVGFIGYWWWRNRKKDQEQIAEFSEEDFSRYS
jgi:hypothetical protein